MGSSYQKIEHDQTFSKGDLGLGKCVASEYSFNDIKTENNRLRAVGPEYQTHRNFLELLALLRQSDPNLAKLYAQLKILFPDDGAEHPTYLFNGRKPIPEEAKNYLVRQILADKRQNVTLSDIGILFGEENSFLRLVDLDELIKSIDQGIEVAIATITRALEPYYQLVQGQLNDNAYQPEHGFNDHRLYEHVMRMVRRSIEQLRLAGYSDEQIAPYLIAWICHDLGNIYDRTIHAWCNEEFFKQVSIQKVEQYGGFSEALVPATGHDEKLLWPILMYIAQNSENTRDFFKHLQVYISPFHWGGLSGDKSEIGYWRIENQIPKDLKALIEDTHFWVNAFCQGTSITRNKSDGICYFDLNFSMYPDKEFLEKLPDLVEDRTTVRGQKLPVSQLFKSNDFKQQSYLEEWAKTISDLYEQRFMILALSLMQLHTAHKVVFRFKDATPAYDVNERRGQYTFVWTRDRIFQKMKKSVREYSSSGK